MSSHETIAALATARGQAAIGIIRTSGPEAIRIASVLSGGRTFESHRATLCTLTHDETFLDSALLLPTLGPNSFTGEDCVEYQCHGGRVTLELVLNAVIAMGARPAEPGEFSRRAMINGKLDLLQVEAIADVIHAESEAAHSLAQAHLRGALSDRLAPVRENLAKLLMLVEAAIDFSLEEDVFTISGNEIVRRLRPIADDVATLLETYTSGRLQHDGVRVAIVGKPNAGKSTLLNLLLQEERAIVTDIAGTTRDYLEESCNLGGVHMRLIDTAGIRETDDRVEAAGVQRAVQLQSEADVVLYVADVTCGTSALDGLVSPQPHQPAAILWTHADRLGDDSPEPAAPQALESVQHHRQLDLLSANSRDVCSELLIQLAEDAGYARDRGSVLLARARHFEVLTVASEALARAKAAAAAEMSHEFIALDLREALDRVGSMTGAVTSDDILNRIFDGFCIGK